MLDTVSVQRGLCGVVECLSGKSTYLGHITHLLIAILNSLILYQVLYVGARFSLHSSDTDMQHIVVLPVTCESWCKKISEYVLCHQRLRYCKEKFYWVKKSLFFIPVYAIGNPNGFLIAQPCFSAQQVLAFTSEVKIWIVSFFSSISLCRKPEHEWCNKFDETAKLSEINYRIWNQKIVLVPPLLNFDHFLRMSLPVEGLKYSTEGTGAQI